jgi:site-specific recombinase XerD
MRENQFREYLENRGFDSSEIEDSISAMKDFEKQLKDNKKTLNSASQEDLKNYLTRLISEGTNTPDRLQSLARYF